MKPTLVTGATGFVGWHVARKLLERGDSVRLLVRDPVCGVHIAEVLAIPLRENGELLHFCSLACRDAYLNSSHKLAANAS